MSRVHVDVEDWQREWVEAIADQKIAAMLRWVERRVRLSRMRSAYRAKRGRR